MRIWLVLSSCILAAGCAATPQQEPARDFFNDAAFKPATERIDASSVFAVSDEMKRYLNVDIVAQLDIKGRMKGLYEALYSKNQLKLEYDAARTRNAAEAFAARSGNCLSLVIMTSAFAKELGLSVRYQRLFVDDSWARANGVYFASGHVNITLGRKQGDPRVLFKAERTPLTIDFLPLAGVHEQFAWDLKEETIVAMYMNNRAAEALTIGNISDAYWWARESVIQDPGYYAGFNTLAVVYRRVGQLNQAERTLKHVLQHEPANMNAMSNLMLVYQDAGRVAEAKALEARLDLAQPNPPFHFFNLGQAAMRQGKYQEARDLFLKELERDPSYHEFHFWLAAAYLGLGDIGQARKHLATAMNNSTTRSEHDLYAAKLDHLGARSPR
jgi:Tfp pilus assembly protein PilF